MSEQVITRESSLDDNNGFMRAVAENLEWSLANAKLLQEVLAEEDADRRNIAIEARSGSHDLGGFFVDEEHSSHAPNYRRWMHTGPSGGDEVIGNVRGITFNEVKGAHHMQLLLDLGYEEGAIPCYFNLNPTLEGCRITRVGLPE